MQLFTLIFSIYIKFSNPNIRVRTFAVHLPSSDDWKYQQQAMHLQAQTTYIPHGNRRIGAFLGGTISS